MFGPSRFPASPVVEALQLIEESATALGVGQGGLNQVKTIMAGLTAIWDAADRNAGIRAAAIDTFEIARALAEAEAPPERFRLRRLLQQALAKLRDRLGAGALTAEASAAWTRAEPLSRRATQNFIGKLACPRRSYRMGVVRQVVAWLRVLLNSPPNVRRKDEEVLRLSRW